ncbi:opioid growth factor receptor conserved region-domain-containing protein [Amylocystis lapponica]|nr:opioid growth factor receptor conserved region-domain-containing protein [Amylocystis lapponica]
MASANSIPNDVREFLEGYPQNRDDATLSANLEFYQNALRCRPDNLLIEELHEKWSGQYTKLEHKHGFIQWLFPIQEYGMNYESQPLQRHEIAAMKADAAVTERVIRSYTLMLDFYGMHLQSHDTGLLVRSPNYAERYRNLVHSSHNYLRISRILKCLSELGLERLSAGFLLHVLNEQSEHGELNAAVLCNSMERWWANCLRNEGERKWIGQMIDKVWCEDNFVFTRDMYETALERQEATGSLSLPL